MKKILLYVFALMLILIPFSVKADWIPVNIKGYSLQATVGSEINLDLTGTNQPFDGTLTYNSNELEYISCTSEVTGNTDDIYSPVGTINIKSNTPGKLTFTFVQNSSDSSSIMKTLTFKFKVKSASSESVKITYAPNNTGVIYGQKSLDISYSIINNTSIDNTTAEMKEKFDDTFNKATDIIDKNINLVDNAFSIFTYVPWIISAGLLVALIVVATKKKNNGSSQ